MTEIRPYPYYFSPDGIEPPLNSLWLVEHFSRTDQFGGERRRLMAESDGSAGRNWTARWEKGDWVRHRIGLDPATNTIALDPKYYFRPGLPLEAVRCLAEPFVAPCELRVQNTSLLVVSVFCLVKAAVCLAAILLLRRQDPLVTPGDAVASFLAVPDPNTENMCCASRRPERQKHTWPLGWLPWGRQPWARGPRQWMTKAAKRRLGAAVPWYIWAFSMGMAITMISIGIRNIRHWWPSQPWSTSVFGPSPSNGNVYLEGWELTHMGTAFKINSSQLGVSIAYLAYNGLFTRMLAEREWTSFGGTGSEYKSLRVSRPSGTQRSTYRLQLPYRWSIPLMLASGTLHWLVSNCVYPQSYISAFLSADASFLSWD